MMREIVAVFGVVLVIIGTVLKSTRRAKRISEAAADIENDDMSGFINRALRWTRQDVPWVLCLLIGGVLILISL